jgi:alpha-glucosidase
MQWDSSDNAGFSSGEPWLPLTDDWQSRNVAEQSTKPHSMMDLTCALLKLRRSEPVLQDGSYQPLFVEGSVLAYERRTKSDGLAVILNLSADVVEIALPDHLHGASVIASTKPEAAPTALASPLRLDGDQGLVVRPAKGDARS